MSLSLSETDRGGSGKGGAGQLGLTPGGLKSRVGTDIGTGSREIPFYSLISMVWNSLMAEGMGFEPTIGLLIL
jgi:hypothetical protein